MRRLSRIASFCLVLALVACAGCRSMKKADGSAADLMADDQQQTTADDDAAETGMPDSLTAVESGPVVFAESDMQQYSKVYPCKECAIIQLDKTMPREIESGAEFEYTIKLTNMTDVTLVDVVLTEEIPDGFKYTKAEPTAEINGSELVWQIGSLRPQANTQVTVSGVANDIAELQYCTSVVTPVVPMCARIAVVKPRLQLNREMPRQALLCEAIPVRYVISNVGTGAADDVRIVDTLPEGLTTADGLSEMVIDVGTLEPGQSREFRGGLKAARAGDYITQAVASTADGLKVETETVTTSVGQPVLSLNQSGPEKLYLGRSVTYEITVTNASDTPARNARIENDIPANVTSMKTTAGAKLVGSKIAWNLDTLGPNASRTVKVSFTPTKAGTLVNRATVSADCADSVTATAKTEIAAIPAVMLEVIDVKDPVEVGDQTTYVITVTNQGSATSKNITVTCVLEDNMQYVSSTGATIGTAEGNTIAFSPLDRLSRKSKATWQVTVRALTAGDVRFKATLNSDELTRPVEETEATRIYE